jgi:hypothetical protein
VRWSLFGFDRTGKAPDCFILSCFPRQNRRPLSRKSALAAFQARARRDRRIKPDETLIEAGLPDLSRENTPIGSDATASLQPSHTFS